VRPIAGLGRNALGQPSDRPRWHERKLLTGFGRRVAPHVLGDYGEAERFSGDRQRRPDCLPRRRRPRDQSKTGLLRKLAELVGCESVDGGLELDERLAIGLQPVARRALPAVAETYRERIAGAQITAPDTDEQRVRVWPDVETVEPDIELGAVARLDGGEVRHGRLVELRLAHVRRGAPRDLYHAGVIDAKLACRVGQS